MALKRSATPCFMPSHISIMSTSTLILAEATTSIVTPCLNLRDAGLHMRPRTCAQSPGCVQGRGMSVRRPSIATDHRHRAVLPLGSAHPRACRSNAGGRCHARFKWLCTVVRYMRYRAASSVPIFRRGDQPPRLGNASGGGGADLAPFVERRPSGAGGRLVARTVFRSARDGRSSGRLPLDAPGCFSVAQLARSRSEIMMPVRPPSSSRVVR